MNRALIKNHLILVGALLAAPHEGRASPAPGTKIFIKARLSIFNPYARIHAVFMVK